MLKVRCLILIFSLAFGNMLFAQSPENQIRKARETWVFMLVGQSNMAGRGRVEPIDTVSSPRVFSINETGEIIQAKEPLHFYEPKMKGTGCGLAFGKELLKFIPEDVDVLLIPTAVGGSSINQWINNSTFRGVQLLTNFQEKMELGKKFGEIKAILWHQGETDAKPSEIPNREEKMRLLFTEFRQISGNPSLPILIGEIGHFGKNDEDVKYKRLLNRKIRSYVRSDKNSALIGTKYLKHKGDKVHFDSESQRKMGVRFAKTYSKNFLSKKK